MQYVITGVLSLIVGIILWAIKRERISLVYDIDESEIFPREKASGKYFICRLRNGGNRAIEHISYKFGLNEGRIESVSYSNSQLIQVSTQSDNQIEGIIPLLNPREELGVVVTIADASKQSTATLEARAIGVTARRRQSESMPEYLPPILLAVAMGVAVTLGFSMWTSLRQSEVNRSIKQIGNIGDIAKGVTESEKTLEELTKKTDELRKTIEREESEVNRGKPDREQMVFAILNKTGLGYVLPTLLATGDELPYWKTGLYLVHFYLADKKNARNYVDALDRLSRIEGIAPSSKGFLLYLAGKVEQDQGNGRKAMEYFETCKKETPLMYEHLMAQDGSYDLRTIEKSLRTFVPNKPIKPTR